jgi:two-component system sensor histidine kinase GlrK
MRFTIFSRLFVGYLVVFVLVTSASVYAVVQLYRLNDITRSVQEVDQRIVDYEKKLTDALLSQIRYERKFVITKDNTLLNQYLLFKQDFERYRGQARAVAGPGEVSQLLDEIQKQHEAYGELLDEEIDFVTSGEHYDQQVYLREKENVSNLLNQALANMRARSQESISAKVAQLDKLGTATARAAIVLTGVSFALGVLILLVITRSIARPIYTLVEKTREVAGGDFHGELKVSSPPEITELATAFNFMCHRLSEIERMKAEFFATMSHELRTPLTSIREGIKLLLDNVPERITDKPKRILGILSEETDRLIGLVNSVLDLSKMEAGMMTYHYDKTSLAALIDRVMDEMGPLAESKRIKLDSKISRDLPIVRVDPERILQALRNLIGNALKFSSEGSVNISARPTDHGVEIAVADLGPGIASKNLVTIFEKFQQANSNHYFDGTGTGLGLAIVKHIVSSHGGKIWVKSEPGSGSTFTLVLPY